MRCPKNSNGKTICGKRYEIPTVKIGDFVFKNVSGLELNQFPGAHTNEKGEEQETPEQFKNIIFKYGTIGIDLFKENHLGVLFDYPGSKLVLTKQGAFPVGYDIATWKKIPFNLSNNNHSTGIFTRAVINGSLYLLLWDSGSSCPVIHIKNKKLFCNRMFGVKKRCDYLRSKSFIVAGHKLKDTHFFILESKASPADGSLGGSFVSNKLLFIDFASGNLFLKEMETEN